MALVKNIEKGFKDRLAVHRPTECSYYVVIEGDRKYLQLDTYGSESRAIPGKISQTIQFSPEALAQLIEICKREGLAV